MERWITEDMVCAALPQRPVDGHKGTFGRVLLVVGSYGMAGAAILSARAALRSGVGLVTVALPRSIYPIVAGAVPEAVFLPLTETDAGQISLAALPVVVGNAATADAVVVGCGLGRGEETAAVVAALFKAVQCPLLLDADGINAISLHTLIEETVTAPRIFTPHPGEIACLVGSDIATVQANRGATAQAFVQQCGGTLVLKGHHTLVATADGELTNPTGNDGMATGGSGDVLAGLIGGLLAQGMPPRDAAMCGVYLHGAAGDRAAARLSRRSLLPSDMIEVLGDLFLQFEK